jgi:hypothetical protein
MENQHQFLHTHIESSEEWQMTYSLFELFATFLGGIHEKNQ